MFRILRQPRREIETYSPKARRTDGHQQGSYRFAALAQILHTRFNQILTRQNGVHGFYFNPTGPRPANGAISLCTISISGCG